MKAFILTLLFAHGAVVASSFLVDGYKNKYPRQFVGEYVESDGKMFILDSRVVKDFEAMRDAAALDGVEILISSAYRTRGEQRYLRKEKGDIAAPVGSSKHQIGLAIDLKNTVKYYSEDEVNQKYLKSCIKKEKEYACKTVEYWWLKKNAKKFGFRNTVKDEPWHYEWFYRLGSTI